MFLDKWQSVVALVLSVYHALTYLDKYQYGDTYLVSYESPEQSRHYCSPHHIQSAESNRAYERQFCSVNLNTTYDKRGEIEKRAEHERHDTQTHESRNHFRHSRPIRRWSPAEINQRIW